MQLRLGTRRSLLAWAQSSWVARSLEKLHPGLQVELVGIDTRGDKVLDISLQKMEGKEFFVAELDEALHASRVDFSVHSLKDLSLERPSAFVMGAIPERENPRDVILWGPRLLEKIAAGKKLKIGTSSPRRLENIPPFLSRALPVIRGSRPIFEFVDIRGNVNTRLSRVHESQESERHLDGVVLAFAGLNRLWRDDAGREELQKLFTGVRWMVLPLRENPTAAGQGALAVECRADDVKVRGILNALHHEPSARTVARERAVLALYGGGCHQKFGASSIAHEELGEVFFVRGRKSNGEIIEQAEEAPLKLAVSSKDLIEAEFSSVDFRSNFESTDAVFFAHSRAAHYLKGVVDILSTKRVYVSGAQTWFKLAEMGIYVEGSAESLGFDFLTPTIQAPALKLPEKNKWVALTHQEALKSWDSTKIPAYATYSVTYSEKADARENLRKSRGVFWHSVGHAELFKSSRHYDKELDSLFHACGAGKTRAGLKAIGIEAKAFLNEQEFEKWLVTQK